MEEDHEVNADFGVKEGVIKKKVADLHTFNFANIKINAVTMKLVPTFTTVNRSLF